MSSRNVKTKTVIRHVLEETGYAYMLSCESSHSNADYADYASSHSLSSFRRALRDPSLSYEDLCKILRRASHKENGRRCKTPWSLFMANYLEKHCNNNDLSSSSVN